MFDNVFIPWKQVFHLGILTMPGFIRNEFLIGCIITLRYAKRFALN